MGSDLAKATQGQPRVLFPGTGICGRSGRAVRPRQAFSSLLHCGNLGLFIHPTAIKCTALFPLFPSSGLTRFSLPTRSLSMPIFSGHSSLNSFSSFPEHAAKPCSLSGRLVTSCSPILLFGELTHGADISCLPVSLQQDCESLRAGTGPGSGLTDRSSIVPTTREMEGPCAKSCS